MQITQLCNPLRVVFKHSSLALAMGAAVFFSAGPAAQAASITYNFARIGPSPGDPVASMQGWTQIFPTAISLWNEDFGWPEATGSLGHLGAGWNDSETQMGRSPEFKLDGTGDLTFQTHGSKSSLAAVDVTPSTVPATAIDLGGFCGLALRDVATDTYLLSKGQSEHSYGVFATLSFTAAELAPYANDGKTYTLDWIDYDKDISSGNGDGWGWLVSVSIPGVLSESTNDSFADAIDLTGAGSGQTGDASTGTQTGTNTIGTTLEVNEPNPGATNTVWFKWTCPADGNLTVSTLGSTNPATTQWDAILGIYTGASVSALTPLATTPQDTGYEETMTVAVSAGTTYSIQLAGFVNAEAANIFLRWTLVATIHQADILTFGPGAIIGEVVGNAGAIAWTMPYGTNLAALAPTFTLSPGATCTVGGVTVHSGDTVDLSSPVEYTVTAQGASPIVNVYTVTVTLAPDESALIWNTTSGDWDFTTPNWLGETSSTLQPFSNALNVIFNSTSGGTINISPGVLPLSITVSAASGNYTFSGGPIGGTGTLTKDGSGTLKIDGLVSGTGDVVLNTYSGGTIMNSGTLHLGGMFAGISPACQGALGTGTVTLNGGMIEFDRYTEANALIANGGTLYSQNGWGATWSGPITLNATLTCNALYTLTCSGAISGTGGLIKTNGGPMILSGINSYTGTTLVTAGVLTCNNIDALGSGALEISTGGAKVNLNYSGEHNVAALILGGTAQSGGTYGSVLSGADFQNDAYFAGTGVVRVPASSSCNMLTFSFGVLGAATISDTTISLEVPYGTDRTNLAPTYTVSPGATASPLSGTPRNFTSPQSCTVTAEDGITDKTYVVTVTETVLADVFTWTTAVPGDWSDSSKWTNDLATGSAPLAGGRESYTLNFNAVGTYTATNNLNAGFLLNQLNLGAAVTLAGNGLAFVASGTTLPTIHQNSGSAVTILNDLDLGADTTCGGSGNGQVNLYGLLSGAGSLTKNGTGTLRIYNVTNSFTGGTIINSGTLLMDIDAKLGSGPVTLNGGTLYMWRFHPANALTVNGGTLLSENGFGNTWDGPITLNTTLTCNVLYQLVCSNTISGPGGLIKTGGGPMILAGTNTYTGPTTVTGGTLQCNVNPDALGSGDLSISSGGKVNLNYSGTKVVASLTLGGVAQTVPGTYGSVASVADFQDDAYFAGGGTVTVVPQAYITAFGANVLGSSAVIDPVVEGAAAISWTVPYGTVLADLAPEFTMSFEATCNQTSGAIPTPNFSAGPVVYTVTSSDSMIINAYTVTVIEGPPSTAKTMSNIHFPGLGDAHATDATATSFVLNVPSGTPVNPLSPTYDMSPLATGSPASGDPLNFSTPRTYRITAQDASWQDYTVAVVPYTGYAAKVAASNPFAYWPLNEGVGFVAYDNSSGNNGSYSNPGVSYNVAGPAGDTAVSFSGAAGVAMQIPHAAALCPDTSFSVEMWVKPAAVPLGTSPQYVAANVNMGAARDGWYLAQDNGGTFGVGQAFVVRMFNQNGANRACQLYAPIDTVRWYHLVLTYDADTMTARFYEDGVTNETDQYGTATLVSYYGNSSANPFTVGKRSDNALPWAGSAAHLAVYTRALTLAEIQNHYQSTGGSYGTWATANGIPGEPASGDFDKDGLTNLMEYALGKSPTLSSQPAGVLSGKGITFTKGADAIANGDVSWVIEESSDLGLADPWAPAVTQLAGDPAPTISYTLPDGAGKAFARLKVTQP